MPLSRATFGGIPVFENPLAIRLSWRWEVSKHPTPKRRKRWAPVRVRVETPCAYETPLGVVMHPVLFAQLKGQWHEHIFKR